MLDKPKLPSEPTALEAWSRTRNGTRSWPKVLGQSPDRRSCHQAGRPRRFQLDRRAEQLIAIAAIDGRDDNALLSIEEVASWLGVSVSFLAGCRRRNDGPKFVEVLPRWFVYRRGDAIAWLRERACSRTGRPEDRAESPEDNSDVRFYAEPEPIDLRNVIESRLDGARDGDRWPCQVVGPRGDRLPQGMLRHDERDDQGHR